MAGSRMRIVTLLAVLGLRTAASASTAKGLCTALPGHGTARVAVLSAFPAELAPLVAETDVKRTVTVDGRKYYLGTLRHVRVVLGLLGIGMVNARARAQTVAEHFRLAGMIVSGVAGSAHPIGDVIVPAAWFEGDATQPLQPNVALLAFAHAEAPLVTLERCTTSDPPVCLPAQPAVLLDGQGDSSDPFNGGAVPCFDTGNDLSGCSLPAWTGISKPADLPVDPRFDVQDMETAAAGRVAAEHRVPWIAFRAVSDAGKGSDFLTYYHLAADNAATVTLAVLEHLGGLAHATRANRRSCALLARGR